MVKNRERSYVMHRTRPYHTFLGRRSDGGGRDGPRRRMGHQVRLQDRQKTRARSTVPLIAAHGGTRRTIAGQGAGGPTPF